MYLLVWLVYIFVKKETIDNLGGGGYYLPNSASTMYIVAAGWADNNPLNSKQCSPTD